MLSLSTGEIPSISDVNGLSLFFDNIPSDLYLHAKRNDFYGSLNYPPDEAERKTERLARQVEKARSHWACITSKSQRVENFRLEKGIGYNVKAYRNLTQVIPVYERAPGNKPPSRTGEKIERFTESSRRHLINKSKKLNNRYMKLTDENGERVRVEKEVPVPYFVTLTYHRNETDCQKAKRDLNVFFQRFRRVNKDFAYMWKMEPQKRGAVHFHVAFFPPSGLFPEKWKTKKQRLEYMRARISSAWNEIAEPGDNQHLKAGTNVRDCDNWKMFIGYCSHYMKKEVGENPFKSKKLSIATDAPRDQFIRPATYLTPITQSGDDLYNSITGEIIPGESKADVYFKFDRAKTGRFWGFSNNLDFKELQGVVVDHEDLEALNSFCNAINTISFLGLKDHLKENIQRAKDQLQAGKITRGAFNQKREKTRKIYEKQFKRYEINRERIRLGYGLQFEIPAEKAGKLMKYLKDSSFKFAINPDFLQI